MVKLVYINHQRIKEIMRDGLGRDEGWVESQEAQVFGFFLSCKTGKLIQNSYPVPIFPKESYKNTALTKRFLLQPLSNAHFPFQEIFRLAMF